MRNENDEFSRILQSQKKSKIIFVLILSTLFINLGILGILNGNVNHLRDEEFEIAHLTMHIQTHSYKAHVSVEAYEETTNISMKATLLSEIQSCIEDIDLLMSEFSTLKLEPQYFEMRTHVIQDWNEILKPAILLYIYYIDVNDSATYSYYEVIVHEYVEEIVAEMMELENYMEEYAIPLLTSRSSFLFFFSIGLSFIIISIVAFFGIKSIKTTKFSVFKLRSINKDLLSSTKEIKSVNRKLEISTNELENYVYKISHDLKTPLISIANFMSLLLPKILFEIDEKSQHYIERIEVNIEEMKSLIVNVLENYKINKISKIPETSKNQKEDPNEIILIN